MGCVSVLEVVSLARVVGWWPTILTISWPAQLKFAWGNGRRRCLSRRALRWRLVLLGGCRGGDVAAVLPVEGNLSDPAAVFAACYLVAPRYHWRLANRHPGGMERCNRGAWTTDLGLRCEAGRRSAGRHSRIAFRLSYAHFGGILSYCDGFQ